MIVAFIGVIGSGKDYQARQLVAQGFVPVDFKEALLQMVERLVGFPIRENYDYFKENILGLTAPEPIGPKFMSRQPAHALTRAILADYPQVMTGRVLLQRLGTDVMRRQDPHYWANQWAAKARQVVLQDHDVVCADCRFPNEMETIRRTAAECRVSARFIFCDYRSARYNPAMEHESERMAQAFLAQGYKDGDEIKEEQ